MYICMYVCMYLSIYVPSFSLPPSVSFSLPLVGIDLLFIIGAAPLTDSLLSQARSDDGWEEMGGWTVQEVLLMLGWLPSNPHGQEEHGGQRFT